MALRALRCPNCNGDINIDDSREFGYCPYCGTKIQLNETIEVKHSGTVKVEGIEGIIGSATNEQIERRVAMLFDYIDGMHSCNFNETANGILNTRDDYRVYLAYILKEPFEINDIYFKKFYSLEDKISDYEKSIQRRFPGRYLNAFMNDTIRLKYLIDIKAIPIDLSNGTAELDDNIFYTMLKRHCYASEDFMLFLGLNPLIRHPFGSKEKPARYYNLSDQSGRKYGYDQKLDASGNILKVHPGTISYFDYAREMGDQTAVNIMQPYVNKLNEEARRYREEQASARKSARQKAVAEGKDKIKEAASNVTNIFGGMFRK